MKVKFMGISVTPEGSAFAVCFAPMLVLFYLIFITNPPR